MGLGHVYRTITLARELPEPVFFITTSGPGVVNKIETSGFAVQGASDDDEVLQILGQRPPGIVILDRLEIDPSFAVKIRGMGHRLVIFGNLSPANEQAQLVVNIIGSDFRNSRREDPKTGNRFFQRPRYYIFKRSFFQRRAEKLSSEKGRMFIMFGGTDPLDLTTLAYQHLSSMRGVNRLDLVVGAGYEHYQELLEEVRNASGGPIVELHRDLEDVASLMTKASLVITSPGMSMFEALFLRRKVLAIAQTPFHDDLFARDFLLYHPEDISRLEEFIESAKLIDPADELIRRMEIGEGRDEVVNAIVDLGVRT